MRIVAALAEKFCTFEGRKTLSMKKYLVTGGAGFIGANFVKYIAATNHSTPSLHRQGRDRTRIRHGDLPKHAAHIGRCQRGEGLSALSADKYAHHSVEKSEHGDALAC